MAPLRAPAPLTPLAADLRAGRLGVADHVAAALHRLEAANPFLQAVLPEPGRGGRLQAEAATLADAYPDPAARPPLFGALMGVKDIFHVAGFVTRAGSELPPELFAGDEAACVTALKAAGALVLGKTVTTEFAYLDPAPTRNPWHLEHSPGGSSSGSAAAVAAGLCPLALGTQTVGSVIRPAAFCGIVGFKPSLGRIATAGILPFSATADTVGLFTQDVAGMALAAGVVCADWRPVPVAAAHRPVLGLPDGPYLAQAEPAALAAFEAQVARLVEAGYELRRVPALADIAAIQQRHRALVAAELAQVHAVWFAQYGHLYGPHVAGLIREGQGVTADELAAARGSGPALRARLMGEMGEAGIDLWICPAATGPAPAGLSSTGNAAMNGVWTHAGLPAVTVPAGLGVGGLPLGLQLVAGWLADEALLGWAAGIAAEFDRRGEPGVSAYPARFKVRRPEAAPTPPPRPG